MRFKIICFFILFILSIQTISGEITSLSQWLLTGKGIKDTDGDHIADKLDLCFIIPDHPTACELAIASELAARANFESLVVDFSLVKKESEFNSKNQSSITPIYVTTQQEQIDRFLNTKPGGVSKIQEHQGFVSLVPVGDKQGIALMAGSQKALLQTGRAFFLRWPYFWEIWGREAGVTYFTLEKDVEQLLQDAGISFSRLNITSALYEFLPLKSPHDAIKRLNFNNGQIKNLFIEIVFLNEGNKEKAANVLHALRLQHQRGNRSDLLTYPGCAQITISLEGEGKNSLIELPRLGAPKRMLTPSYKRQSRPKITGKDFDLQKIFSEKGFYADSNNDKILDQVDSFLIIPHDLAIKGVESLASRLVLHSAGASFPLLYLDQEIENKKALKAPILVGKKNILVEELIKKGKMKIPALEKSWGMATVVPEAFNKSNALALVGADALGLEKLLVYFSQTFPYLSEFGEGKLGIQDISGAFKDFFEGRTGSAEAYFQKRLEQILQQIGDKEFELFESELNLPQQNEKFKDHIQEHLENSIRTEKLDVKSTDIHTKKTIFEKEREFPWEVEEAFNAVEQKLSDLKNISSPMNISIGVSESPSEREKLKARIEDILIQNSIHKFTVDVYSSYKQGFFWLAEKILPSLQDTPVSRLIIRVAKEKENFNIPKRFYSEPYRWLQELYPIDEIISHEVNIPLKNITFEMKENGGAVYEVQAFDESNNLLLEENFSPRTRVAPYLKVLPEWGDVKLTTGWVRITIEDKVLLDSSMKSDLEYFWDYYQSEILPEVYAHILKKTGDSPSFKKQPYFKKLQIEMWFSEPDFQLGLDEEIISSLEAMHDEIYFDTLDFLRGITDVTIEDEEIPEDTSRYSAPGNILPLIHASTEGASGKVKITFTDWQSRSPQMIIRWKEKNKNEKREVIKFPKFKTKDLELTSLIFNGSKDRIENILAEVELEKEEDYVTLIEIIESRKKLTEKGVLFPFQFPNLHSLSLRLKNKNLIKDETFLVEDRIPDRLDHNQPIKEEEFSVPTDQIISPQMCLEMTRKLGQYSNIKSYIAGESFEKRKIPVLEIFQPLSKYTSIPRLITLKPTLYISGRQHANEVSATNYILKFVEHLAKTPEYQEFLKKMNFVFHPMENPDGAELAYNLQKITPFHSLHAGRYTSLGIDVGYQVSATKPILPEAKVRNNLYQKWFPDIYLNLHGYPSHEWVQQFSNYSPYLFRDYWIPRGWFAFYRTLSLPLYENWVNAGRELKAFIIDEMNANDDIRESNKKFYDRYYRWAARWQPHMNYLELYNGLNLYSKRRSSQERKLSSRRRMTFIEETPELMDETAQGPWLDFLCQQGLAYIHAHVKYFNQAQFEIIRLEEEFQDRVQIKFLRGRPGKTKPK